MNLSYNEWFLTSRKWRAGQFHLQFTITSDHIKQMDQVEGEVTRTRLNVDFDVGGQWFFRCEFSFLIAVIGIWGFEVAGEMGFVSCHEWSFSFISGEGGFVSGVRGFEVIFPGFEGFELFVHVGTEGIHGFLHELARQVDDDLKN